MVLGPVGPGVGCPPRSFLLQGNGPFGEQVFDN
jgi:hypothetical protein